ncbi:uncharacterized protein [Argopecten irradians]|uniref:uncharacterized protein n=1 Tax=Argopecten irradians TaxID=31199 RepID=UPI00371E7D66
MTSLWFLLDMIMALRMFYKSLTQVMKKGKKYVQTSVDFKRRNILQHIKNFDSLHGFKKLSCRGFCVDRKCELSQLYIRQTTPDDHDDLVSLRKHVYDGKDYIPSSYHDLLKCNTGVAGYIDNKMVGFIFASIIDDGTTVLLQSGRVRIGYEGLGIVSQLKRYYFRNLPAGVNKSVINTSSPEALRHAQRRGSPVVFQRNAITFRTSKTDINAWFQTIRPNFPTLESVDIHYFKRICRSRESKTILFPEDRIVLKRVPYRLLTSNTSHVFSCNPKMFASKCETEKRPEIPSMMSASTNLSCEVGMVMYLDLYGDISDVENVTDHVGKQLSYCLDTYEGDILFLYITCAAQFSVEDVARVLSVFPLELVGNEVTYCVEETIE